MFGLIILLLWRLRTRAQDNARIIIKQEGTHGRSKKNRKETRQGSKKAGKKS